MYTQFYGFTEKPFTLIPNPEFLYLSPDHKNALTHLEYGLSEGQSFIMLSGDIGTGKTTLVRYLLDHADDDLDVAMVFNTNVDADQLLILILQELDLPVSHNDKAGMIDTLFQYLIEKFSAGRRVLIVIDEAQNLDGGALEEVRMLSNLQSNEHILLQVMLVGQPELRDTIESPALAQLNQRIAVRFHLKALTEDETVKYIRYRLQKAGGRADLFGDDAMALIFQASQGVPRLINKLCDAALVYGYADSLKHIDHSTVEQVLQDQQPNRAPASVDQGQNAPSGDDRLDSVCRRLAAVEDNCRQLQSRIEKLQIAESSRPLPEIERLQALEDKFNQLANIPEQPPINDGDDSKVVERLDDLEQRMQEIQGAADGWRKLKARLANQDLEIKQLQSQLADCMQRVDDISHQVTQPVKSDNQSKKNIAAVPLIQEKITQHDYAEDREDMLAGLVARFAEKEFAF